MKKTYEKKSQNTYCSRHVRNETVSPNKHHPTSCSEEFIHPPNNKSTMEILQPVGIKLHHVKNPVNLKKGHN